MKLKSKIVLILGVVALTLFGMQYALATKTVFTDGTPSLGIKGTKVTAAFLNAVNKHFCTGLDVDGDCALAYSAATGTNDLITTFTPTTVFPAAYVTGMPLYIKTAATSTGAMTLNANGIGQTPIKKRGSTALVAGDVQAGQIITVSYDGTNFQLQNPASDSNKACFYAYLSSDQTVTTIQTAYKVNLNTETIDTNSNFSAGRFTPTVPGKYMFWGSLGIVNSGGSPSNPPYGNAAIYLNGAVVHAASDGNYGMTHVISGGFNGTIMNSNIITFPSVILTMNGTTDYVELWGYMEVAAGTSMYFYGSDLSARPVPTFLAGCRVDN